MNQKQEDKFFQQGFDAYHAEKDEDENPYAQNTEKWDIWKHGWQSAFECEVMEEP